MSNLCASFATVIAVKVVLTMASLRRWDSGACGEGDGSEGAGGGVGKGDGGERQEELVQEEP